MSETDFLKLKKHDNVETNTEKFDIENYLNGNWDKINENAKKVNTDILNINSKNKEQDTNIEQLQEKTETSSNKIAELEKELKEAQEDFYQNSIRGQASGEYIHVEDSSNCRSIIGISGNSEQETRSGKNKIEITKTTTTVNGCTHTIKDGTDTLSGTSSTNWANLIIYSFVGDGKTYTLSGSPSTSKNIFISAHDKVQKKDLATSKNGSTGTFVATSGNSIDIIICVAPNLTLANELFKPQLEEGSKATVWEQGGASPSPDYPSEVESVGSNVQLFDKESVKKNYRLGSTGELFPDKGYFTSDYIELVPKSNYMLSVGTLQGSTAYAIYDSDKKFISRTFSFTKNTYSISNSTSSKQYIRVSEYLTDIDNVKLEKGTVATPHSKYGQGCVKVTKCNKNLFDKDNAIKEYELNGTTGKIMSNSLYFTSDYIRVNPNEQYYLSGKNTGNSNCFYNKDKKFISKINLENGLLTVPDDLNIYYLRINSRLTAIDTTMLEKNTKKSAYEEHQEQSYIIPTQQPMRSKGDIRDTFIKKDGKWYERHNINRRIFDGTTNKFIRTSGITNNLFVTNTFEDGNIIVPLTYGKNVQHFNNYFQIKYASDEMYQNANYVGSAIRPSDDMVMGFGKESEINTVDKANAWLKAKYDAGAPLYVDYLLETPIDIECTEEQSKILDELNNARTYKNVTNITTDSKAILSLDYAKDLETLLNNTQALAVNNASEGV